MSRKLSLPALLKKLYAENSRFDLGPPVQILKELESNILVLSDTEISDEDVPVLCRFFNHPETCKQIKRIQVDRTSSRKAFVRRYDSAFVANNCRLLKELFKFIGNAKALQCVCFESTEIPVETLPLLGKSLTTSKSPITWLGFRDCVFGGDEGLRIMTHYIGKLNLQVLALEQCQLTDASIVYIASILKAQQNNLDSLYWNATLRVDPGLRGALWNASEIDEVYRCGLVALSLYGNRFEGKDMYALTRVLRNNHWLLGLNLANNQLTRENMVVLIEELFNNTVLQTVLLKNNPGLDERLSGLLFAAIQRNTVDCTTDTTTDVVEDLELRHNSGFRRLELQSPRIALLLHTWQQLQWDETIAPQQLQSTSQSHIVSTESAATTMGSGSKATSLSVRARRGIIAAAAAKEAAAAVKLRGKAKGTTEAARAGTRLAFEEHRYANMETPYGYSVLDLVPDKPPTSPKASPYSQPNSPKSRAQSPGNSFTSFFGSSFSSQQGKNVPSEVKHAYESRSATMHRSFSASRVDMDAPTQRFQMADFQQPRFRDSSSRNSRNEESIQLSMGSREDYQDGPDRESTENPVELIESESDSEGHDSADDRDFMDHAIPTGSPTPPSGEYYIGMNKASPGDRLLAQLRAQAQSDLDEWETKETDQDGGWGDVDWPLPDNPADESANENSRPPSRISIRHRTGSHSHSSSPINTTRASMAMDEEYLRLKAMVEQFKKEDAANRRPPRSSAPVRRRASPAKSRPHTTSTLHASVNRSSHTGHLPVYMQPTSSSLSGWVSSKHPTRPFYAGGSLPGAASPPKHNSAKAKHDLAMLYGTSSGYANASSTLMPVPDYLSHRKVSSAPCGKKKSRTASAGRARKSVAPVPEPTMGRAKGPRGTRIRARSADRAEYRPAAVSPPQHHHRHQTPQQHHYPHHSVRPVTPLGTRTPSAGAMASTPSNTQFMADLSHTVLTATKNMELVSTKLKDVIETLSTSMDMNFSMQRELQSASLLNASLMNTSRGGWDSTPAPSAQRSGGGRPAMHSTPASSSAQRYRDLSASPLSFGGEDDIRGRPGAEVGQQNGNAAYRTDDRMESAVDPAADPELTQMVKDRLELRLRAMLEG